MGVKMIDWDRVCELRTEIGNDDFSEVVTLFLEEADEVAETLDARMTPEAIESALHFLKGSALNLGFRELANLCQIGEKSAATGLFKSIDLDRVRDVYERSKSTFAAGKESENAA